MLSRRAFLLSSAALAGFGGGQAGAQDRFDQAALLDFWSLGQITLMHMGPLLGEMMPHYHRPPEMRIGVGDAAGKVPYLTGEAFRVRYSIGGRTPMDYAHTHEHFVEHARAYGKMGGVARVATVLNAIRAERPGALFLAPAVDWMPDGLSGLSADPLNGSALAVDASSAFAFTQSKEAAKTGHVPYDSFERGGTQIRIVHDFGSSEDVRRTVNALEEDGADLIVCMSIQTFEMCAKLAVEVPELDIILAGGSAYPVPEPEIIGTTRVFSSGTQGRFVTRIDAFVSDEGEVLLEHKLIPVFSDLIAPDPQLAAQVQAKRAASAENLQQVLGQAEALLYRRGALSSSWDEVICAALMAHYGVEIALTLGLRVGRDILPGQDITREDIISLTGTHGFAISQTELTGAALKDLLEGHAEQAFAKDPRRRRDIDMLRVGGVGFELDVNAQRGARIWNLVHLSTNKPLEMDQIYPVAGWVFAPGWANGSTLAEVMETYITRRGRVGTESVTQVSLKSSN